MATITRHVSLPNECGTWIDENGIPLSKYLAEKIRADMVQRIAESAGDVVEPVGELAGVNAVQKVEDAALKPVKLITPFDWSSFRTPAGYDDAELEAAIQKELSAWDKLPGKVRLEKVRLGFVSYMVRYHRSDELAKLTEAIKEERRGVKPGCVDSSLG